MISNYFTTFTYIKGINVPACVNTGNVVNIWKGDANMSILAHNSGVYAITNTINGHRYIGSSTNISKRWVEHKRMLRANKHHSVYLQRAWNKYGESAFLFELLRVVNGRDNCIIAEQEYIDSLRPEYNIAPKAISPGGTPVTEATREKLRANAARLVKDEGWLAKVTKALIRGQAKAIEWHRSEAGRDWSRENYKNSLALTHTKTTLICEQCGKEYEAEKGKFCSKACQAKWRRGQGVDDETRNCVVCGKAFTVNRYRETKTCSKSCSQSESITQMDLNGRVLMKYKNAQEAANKTGIDHSNICKCCRGVYKHAGGFLWRYTKDGQ